MKFFGPLFDRSLARKAEDRATAIDSSLTAQKTVPGDGLLLLKGGMPRIISTAKEEIWRHRYYAIGYFDWTQAYTNAATYRLTGSRGIKKPGVTYGDGVTTSKFPVNFKQQKGLGPMMWATATDNALDLTASSGYSELIPVGGGEAVIRTTAVYAGGVLVRWSLYNSTLKKSHGSLAPNTSIPFMDIGEVEHWALPDFADGIGVFTGWLQYSGSYRQGFAVFVREYVTEGTEQYEHIRCIASVAGFTAFNSTYLPAPATSHAGPPFMVCSAARRLAGIVYYADPDAPATIAHLVVSSDGGFSWTSVLITEIAASTVADPYTPARKMGGAASGVGDVFVFDTGDVLLHAPGATTYTYIVGALPVSDARRVAHLGGGVFLCFTAVDSGGGVYVTQLHRSTNGGASWSLITTAPITGLPIEYVGTVLVDTPYVSPSQAGRCVLPYYKATDSCNVLLESMDAGATWGEIGKMMLGADTPPANADEPTFGRWYYNLVDLGETEQLYVSGLLRLDVATDPSRPTELIES